MSAPVRHPIYLDTDLGIDDALALALLLHSPEAALVGVGSVHGNVDAATAAQNVLDLLALAAPAATVPVALGSEHPLRSAYHGGSPRVHGGNGLGGVMLARSAARLDDRTAAQLLVDLAHEHRGALRVVAIGPLTNLAYALELEPALPDLVEGVYVMGGAALAPGNVTPVAEANITHDPDAAAAVLAAPWRVVLVPLDATMDQRLTDRHNRRLAAEGGPEGAALAAMVDFYADYYTAVYGERDVALHDPLAAALALDLVEVELGPAVPVQVDTTDGPGRGQTICDLRGRYRGYPAFEGPCPQVVLAVRGDFPTLLVDRLVSSPAAPG